MSYVEDLDKANMRIKQLVDEIHDRAAVEADLRHRADTAEAKLTEIREILG